MGDTPSRRRRRDPRVDKFVREFTADFDAKQAAIRAGYSQKGATAAANRLLERQDIVQRLQVLLRPVLRRQEVTSERIVAELAAIGFSDIRDVLEWDPDSGVKVKASAKLDPGVAAAISEVRQTDNGAIRVKLYDKLGALAKLGMATGLFREEAPVVVTPGQVQATVNVYLPSNGRPPRVIEHEADAAAPPVRPTARGPNVRLALPRNGHDAAADVEEPDDADDGEVAF